MSQPLINSFRPLKISQGSLELATKEDAEKVLKYFLSNKERLTPFEPLRPSNFYTLDFWTNRIAKNIEEFANDESLRLFIFDKERNIAGTVNFTQFARGPFQACYLGFAIDANYEGKGLMSEALSSAIEYIFDDLKFHRIMANHLPDNTRSARLLSKLGFVKEGYAKDYLFINNRWQDHVLTSLTNGIDLSDG